MPAPGFFGRGNPDPAIPTADDPDPPNTSENPPIFEPANFARSTTELPDQQQTEILNMIGTGYLAAEKLAEEIPPQVDYGIGITINIQFLAACLRLAVDFDFTASGTLTHLENLLPPAARRGAENALKQQFDIKSAGSHPHVQATILVEFLCCDAEVHRALRRYESYLQRLIFNLNRTIRPRFLFTAVQFEITPQGYHPIDFKFGVDTSSAWQLFAGNTLYKDRRVFLRELIQNAVDACNLRQMREPDFGPSIGVEFSSGLETIIFRDNGIGMSRQWIEKYFRRVSAVKGERKL